MHDVLLTVSGTLSPTLDDDIAAGRRPEADYRAMARAFGAKILDYSEARRITDRVGRLLDERVGPNAMLAWTCYRERKRYRVIFTDGEQVGLPLALLLKHFDRRRERVQHLMIVHILSVRKKTLLLDGLKLFTHIDKFFVYSTWQERFIRQRWGIPSERVVFTPFMVDDKFFAPSAVSDADWPRWLAELKQPVICAVGLERRDYETLIDAVRGLDVRVVIAAASPWSKQSDTTQGRQLPDNVIVRKFSQFELRLVYHRSAFLVMPLEPVEFQAGVTAILEAMAMGKPVVCTRTDGQTDVLREGETGLYVPPKDAAALRSAIQQLLADPERAARMGERARRVIEDQMNLERYCQRLAEHVKQAAFGPKA